MEERAVRNGAFCGLDDPLRYDEKAVGGPSAISVFDTRLRLFYPESRDGVDVRTDESAATSTLASWEWLG